MPQVRTTNPQVQEQAAPNVRKGTILGAQLPTAQKSGAPSPESLGSGLGRTMARVGQQLYLEEKTRQDNLQILGGEDAMIGHRLRILNDPERGLLNRRGADVAGIHEEFRKEFGDAADKVIEGAHNQEQRDALNARRMRVEREAESQILVHQQREFESAATIQLNSGVELSIESALANADDDLAVGEAIEDIRTRYYAYGQPRNKGGYGKGELWIKEQTDAKVSQVRVGVINLMLAAEQHERAAQQFEDYGSEIAGSARAGVIKALGVGSTRGESQLQADRILHETATQEEAVAAARQIKDPEVRDSVEDRVNQDWARRKQAESDRRQEQNRLAADAVAQAKAQRDQAMKGLANLIDARKTIDAIPPHIWADMTIAERKEVESYAKLLEKGPIETNQARWYALVRQAGTDPKKFAELDLMMDRSRLSDSDLQELGKLQLSIKQGKDKEAAKQLQPFMTKDQVFRDALQGTELQDPKAGSDAEGLVVKLRKALDDKYQARQIGGKPEPTLPEVRQDMDELLINLVMEDGYLSDTTKFLFDVTIADVPPSAVAIINDNLSRAGVAATSANVLAAYKNLILGAAPAPGDKPVPIPKRVPAK